jgi:DNA-dependent RNA polymerase auxiliary subunit epsilon
MFFVLLFILSLRYVKPKQLEVMKVIKDKDIAIEYAKKVSAKQLKCIEVVQRYHGGNYIVCDKGGKDRKANDKFIQLVKNFDTPYYMRYISPKSGEHIDFFPTKELRDKAYSDKIATDYYYSFNLGKL